MSPGICLILRAPRCSPPGQSTATIGTVVGPKSARRMVTIRTVVGPKMCRKYLPPGLDWSQLGLWLVPKVPPMFAPGLDWSQLGLWLVPNVPGMFATRARLVTIRTIVGPACADCGCHTKITNQIQRRCTNREQPRVATHIHTHAHERIVQNMGYSWITELWDGCNRWHRRS